MGSDAVSDLSGVVTVIDVVEATTALDLYILLAALRLLCILYWLPTLAWLSCSSRTHNEEFPVIGPAHTVTLVLPLFRPVPIRSDPGLQNFFLSLRRQLKHKTCSISCK